MAKKMIDISILGDKQTARRLHRLVSKVQKRVVGKALRAGGKPVLAATKAKAPVDTGRLKGSLKLRTARLSRRRKRQGEFGMEVRTGTREELGLAPDATGYYPISQEYGWKLRGGGAAPARPYMRPAADERRREALGIIGREIASGVKREARRR